MIGNPRWLDAARHWLPVAAALLGFGGIAVLQRDVTSWWAFAAIVCAVAYGTRERWPVVALAASMVVVAATRLPAVHVLTGRFDVAYLLLVAVPALPLVAVSSRWPAGRSWPALVATAGVTIAVCPDPAWSASTSTGSGVAVAWVLTVGVPATAAVVAWLAGSTLYARQQYAEVLLERTAALERSRAAESAASVAAERSRIALELHDAITHTVAIMVVQASAAGAIWDRDPDRAREALRAVEESGRTVMADLRGTLGAMRGEAPRAAAPGVGELPALVERVRSTGLAAELTLAGPVGEISAAKGLSVLRVAQESVTNALRHAHASSIAIDLSVLEGGIRLSVADDGVGVAAASHDPLDPGRAGGHGILGMRERAAGLGGTLDVARGADGGTVVALRAPL